MKLGNMIMAEISVGGSVRDVTRRGKVDTRVYLKGDRMEVHGPLGGLLSYCAFESLEALARLPEGLLEWSCHKGKYGVKGDHIVVWEFIEL